MRASIPIDSAKLWRPWAKTGNGPTILAGNPRPRNPCRDPRSLRPARGSKERPPLGRLFCRQSGDTAPHKLGRRNLRARTQMGSTPAKRGTHVENVFLTLRNVVVDEGGV